MGGEEKCVVFLGGCYGGRRETHAVFLGGVGREGEGKRTHEIPTRRWGIILKIVLKKSGSNEVDWIFLTHDRNKGRFS